MEKNEIKKALYKEKPTAKLEGGRVYYHGELGRSDYSIYTTNTSLGRHTFIVKHDDMGEGLFEEEVPAQLLIRWLV